MQQLAIAGAEPTGTRADTSERLPEWHRSKIRVRFGDLSAAPATTSVVPLETHAGIRRELVLD